MGHVLKLPNLIIHPLNTTAHLSIAWSDIEMSKNMRIFLSHKGVDKPLVRRIYRILKHLGFDPWLDESDMDAGFMLEQDLLAGIKNSCAAVFFITPSLEDENFLATEIDYAIGEKRRKHDRFSIITLVISEGDRKGKVPDLLKRYVWKQPEYEIEMLDEILKALPLAVGDVGWRV